MTNSNQIITIITQTGAFIATFAAMAAGILLFRVTKKIGSGILASGFKTASIGIFCIATGILIDAIVLAFPQTDTVFISILLIIKVAFYAIGANIVVISSKNIADKLESITT